MNAFKRTLYFITFFVFEASIAQQNFTISGYVTDKNTGESLIGATIHETVGFSGTSTNGYGYYSLTLPEGQQTIVCSYLGYQSESFDINLQENISKNISLSNEMIDLDAVTVTAELETNPLIINDFSVDRLTMEDIRKLPNLIGEADVIKAIQLQSGVKTLGDGSSGMFIRGGSSDQNLILIDEAPIYNPAHMFGLISVFNPDAVNHVTLYKSNMPAQYGGRVSSVIDSKMKEGNLYEYDYSAGISPFSTTFTVSGPVVKETAAFFFSGRKSLSDLFLKPEESINAIPGFYDLNLKFNSRIGIRDRVFVSFYKGEDLLETSDGFFNVWGNTSATLRWNRTIGDKMFLNTSLISSDYQNNLEFNEDRNYKWRTGLNDLNLKFDLSYLIRPGNVIEMGVGSINHKFIPGETADSLQSIPRIQAFEHSFYLLNNIQPTKWLGLNYGIRLSSFQNHGQATWYDYNEFNIPTQEHTNKKGVYANKFFVEPRISTNFKLNPKLSVKVAYARNVQYMQVLQNNNLSYTSLETWFPTNRNIKPILVDVVSAGWFHSLGKAYFVSVESYYKAYQNQIDFVDHAALLNNAFIEGEIRNGTARAYGAEFNLKKETGKLQWTISYTYSKALRKVNGINNGEEYNSPFDIPHDFRIISNYKLNHKWSLGTAWLYMSGRPFTSPVGFYTYLGNIVPTYSERNGNRFPDYHRLDISFSREPTTKNGKFYWSMNFGIYNLYSRKNPLLYRFEANLSSATIKVWQQNSLGATPNFSFKVDF